MSDSSSGSLPLKITLKTILNIALVWAMATYLSQFFDLKGGWRALVIVGVLITLMNILVRPLLALVTLPLRLFATILAVIIVNGAFVELIILITQNMDPTLVKLEIVGGLFGWIVVAAVMGFGNWVMKEIFR